MAELQPVRIWDLPTRLFHWALVGLILFAWWSAATDHLDWHKRAGAAVAGLVAFRIWWGLFGASTARFSHFLRGPRAVAAYARHAAKDKTPSAGHNPMGGWSVAALLVLITGLVGFGLFAVDVDGLESGPLSRFLDFDGGRLAAKAHGLAFDVLKWLVGLHLAAIAVYALWKRENLTVAMITGRKRLARSDLAMQPGAPLPLAVGLGLGLAVAGGLVWLSR